MDARGRDADLAEGCASAAVIVAHPDDEVLWAGGLILTHPGWRWTVAALSRAGDPDRAPKFAAVMDRLHAAGVMADLDDGPDQAPLDPQAVREAVLSVLPAAEYDLLLTHSPFGEYTRHRRHEEVARAVLELWEAGRISARGLWMFAYDDGGRRHLPRPIRGAHKVLSLPPEVWRRKRSIIMDVYGFPSGGFEARTVSRKEAFWVFDSPRSARTWMETGRPRT